MKARRRKSMISRAYAPMYTRKRRLKVIKRFVSQRQRGLRPAHSYCYCTECLVEVPHVEFLRNRGRCNSHKQ